MRIRPPLDRRTSSTLRAIPLEPAIVRPRLAALARTRPWARPGFEHLYAFDAADPVAADPLLDPRIRHRLVRFEVSGERIAIEASGHRLSIDVAHPVQDAAILGGFLDLAEEIAESAASGNRDILVG